MRKCESIVQHTKNAATMQRNSCGIHVPNQKSKYWGCTHPWIYTFLQSKSLCYFQIPILLDRNAISLPSAAIENNCTRSSWSRQQVTLRNACCCSCWSRRCKSKKGLFWRNSHLSQYIWVARWEWKSTLHLRLNFFVCPTKTDKLSLTGEWI